ncbi:MAG: twin-arginine translocation (Tat), partial [Methylocella sp.]
MLKRPFRIYALSLAGGALLLGGATMAAGAMPLPGTLPGGVMDQATAAIVTDGADAAKVEQVYWRGRGWRGRGWHRGYGWRGRGWHR